MKKTYISPAIRIIEANIEAILSDGSFDNQIENVSLDDGYSISSKESFFDSGWDWDD